MTEELIAPDDSGTVRRRVDDAPWHAAYGLAGRRLEREGFARWEDGAWRLRERAQVRGLRLLLAAAIRSQFRTPRAQVTGSKATEPLQYGAEAA